MTEQGPRSRSEIRDELEFYLEERTRELMGQGMSEDEARENAMKAFGDLASIENEMFRTWEPKHRGWGWREMMGSVLQDLRFALRTFVRNPGFTVVAVVTLALGIGANTAIFSVADAALLTRPEVVRPQELVNVYTTCRLGFPRCSTSYPDYLDYRDRTTLLADLAVVTTVQANLGEDAAGAQLITAAAVTGNYFPLTGVVPARGRLIQPLDDILTAPAQVAVLSHGLWTDFFGSDPEIVGTSVRINEAPFQVVGVADPEFRGTTLSYSPDLWIPLASTPVLDGDDGSAAPRQAGSEAGSGPPEVFQRRSSRWMGTLVGRLVPGATAEQLRQEMASITQQLFEEYPDERGPRSITVDEAGMFTLPVGFEGQIRQFIWLLLGVVAVSLLLATANLANLLLTRATGRQREIGVRMAIGAGRGRVIRQLLSESVALSVVGGVAGVGVAAGLLAALSGYDLPGGLTLGSLGVRLDGRVLAFTFVLSALTGLVFGLYPALQASRTSVSNALRGELNNRGSGTGRTRSALISFQVTMCVVLLAGAGAFLATLRSGLQVDLGFPAEGLAVARFNLELNRYSPEQARRFVLDLEERVENLPGVTEAAITTRVPLQTGGFRGIIVQVDGYELAEDEEIRVEMAYTTPGLVETLGGPLLAGRALDRSDVPEAPRVFLINRTFAERYWPAGGATDAAAGTIDYWGTSVEVAGVFDNVSWMGVQGQEYPVAFVPMEQNLGSYVNGNLTLVARTTGDEAALAIQLRDEIKALDSDVEPSYTATMQDLLATVLMPQRLGTLLLSVFALLAVTLAGVGIAGVVSYSVSQRVREMGLRIALGASSRQVTRLVVRGVALPILVGVGVGAVAASALAGAASAFILFDVDPADPVRLAGVVALLLGVGVLAAFLPARKAAGVDPMAALRSD